MLQKVKVGSHTMPGRQGRSIMNTKEHEVMKRNHFQSCTTPSFALEALKNCSIF